MYFAIIHGNTNDISRYLVKMSIQVPFESFKKNCKLIKQFLQQHHFPMFETSQLCVDTYLQRHLPMEDGEHLINVLCWVDDHPQFIKYYGLLFRYFLSLQKYDCIRKLQDVF